MLDTGAPHNLPYPVAAVDPPNGAGQIQALAEAVAPKLVQSGKCIVATEQTVTEPTVYTLMGTPDRVSDIVLPEDGLIAVFYHAMMQAGSADTASAAIFLDEQQVKLPAVFAAAPVAQSGSAGTAGRYGALSTYPAGLIGIDNNPAYTGPVTTGQILGVNNNGAEESFGGPCYIFAAAGTYDVSIRFRTGVSSSSVLAKQRRLRVLAIPF